MILLIMLQVYDKSEAAGYWGDKRKCDTPLRTIEAMYRHIRAHHPDLDLGPGQQQLFGSGSALLAAHSLLSLRLFIISDRRLVAA